MSEPTDTAKQDHRQNCVNDVENNVLAIYYILALQATVVYIYSATTVAL